MSKYHCLLLIVMAGLLSSCATFANLQLQKKQLADGSMVYVDEDVMPTSDWHCQLLTNPVTYTPDLENAEFEARWPNCALQADVDNSTIPAGKEPCAPDIRIKDFKRADIAVYYANLHHFKPNYINIQTTKSNVLAHYGNDGSQEAAYLAPPTLAAFYLYRCEFINPDHQISFNKKTTTSIGTSAGESVEINKS